MRYAIYFTPEHDDPLTRVAEKWLGRSAFGKDVRAPVPVGSFSAAEIAFHTAPPRRYGFHATLKAPFRLADNKSENELGAALDRFCANRAPVHVERIRLARLGNFFALVPEAPEASLNQLADDVVTTFEPFRAPLTQTEIQRRNPDSLTPPQLKNLQKWGYPYAFEEFRFHMTLMGNVPTPETERMEQAITSFFGPLLLEPLEITSLALFMEPEPGAPFQVRSIHPIGAVKQKKTA